MAGGDKTLEDVEGEPLLTRLARIAARTGYRTIVALPPDRPARAAALSGTDAHPVVVEIASLGMSASLKVGAAAAGDGALLVMLADMPEIGGTDLTRLIDAFVAAGEDRVVRAATEDGRPGHPLVLPARVVAALPRLQGDIGARQLLAEEDEILTVPLPGARAVVDLDTPEAWAAWRAGRRSDD